MCGIQALKVFQKLKQEKILHEYKRQDLNFILLKVCILDVIKKTISIPIQLLMSLVAPALNPTMFPSIQEYIFCALIISPSPISEIHFPPHT